VDSEPELQELRTPPALAGLDTVPAPGIRAATPRGPAAGAHLSRAFATAGRETSGAFRTAARALRSVF
jgi:hypothetical protein